jgi:hypothetical protein
VRSGANRRSPPALERSNGSPGDAPLDGNRVPGQYLGVLIPSTDGHVFADFRGPTAGDPRRSDLPGPRRRRSGSLPSFPPSAIASPRRFRTSCLSPRGCGRTARRGGAFGRPGPLTRSSRLRSGRSPHTPRLGFHASLLPAEVSAGGVSDRFPARSSRPARFGGPPHVVPTLHRRSTCPWSNRSNAPSMR